MGNIFAQCQAASFQLLKISDKLPYSCLQNCQQTASSFALMLPCCLSVPTCSSHSYLTTFLLGSADAPLGATEPLSLLRPFGHCCITIIILDGLIHFPLKSVDVQHSASFSFESYDKRSRKSSLYCGFSTPVLPSASR